jgi:hypothetical protein
MVNRGKTRDRILLFALRHLPHKLATHLMFLLRSNPSLTDRWGYHVRPIHYYEPLPDFRGIVPANTTHRRQPPSIDFNLSGQVALIRRLATLYCGEVDNLAAIPEPDGFNFHNDYFAGLDAAVYYALIRDLKPTRVIEIGSGYSTRIADKAIRRNRAEGQNGELVCIEPYPQPRLTEAKLQISLIQKRVQDVDTGFLTSLKADDILFIDSSHAVKFGSDVCHEVLELLPRLKPGVYVHVHDIFFPNDYPAEWLMEKRIAFNEQYLLEAFLSFNDSFAAVAANHWMYLEYLDDAAQIWPQIRNISGPHGHASFWMRKMR